MSVSPSPIGGFAAQFFDNNGQPLSGGKIFTYVAGTTTPLATYTSASGATPHTNPIVLDSAGRVPGGEIWLTNNLSYKFVLETATSILIGTYDNIDTSISSENVTFIQAGTGAVVRTVQTKLREVEVSVLDFGGAADCTGPGVGTDVVPAIQKAVDYIVGSIGNGARLVLPPGRYRASTSAVLDLNRLTGITFDFQGLITPDAVAMTMLTIQNAESFTLNAHIFQGGIFNGFGNPQPYGPCDYGSTRDAAAAGGQEAFLIRGIMDYTVDLSGDEYGGRLLRTDERSNINQPFSMAIKGRIQTRRNQELSGARVAQSLWADGGTVNPNIGNWGALSALVCDFDFWGPVFRRLNDVEIALVDAAFSVSGLKFEGCQAVTGGTWYVGDTDTPGGARHVEFLPRDGIDCGIIDVKSMRFLNAGDGLYMDGVSNASTRVEHVGPVINFSTVVTLINCTNTNVAAGCIGNGVRLASISGSLTNNVILIAESNNSTLTEDAVLIESDVTGVVVVTPVIEQKTNNKSAVKVAGGAQVFIDSPILTGATGFAFDIFSANNSVSVFGGRIFGPITPFRNSISPTIIESTVGVDRVGGGNYRSNIGAAAAGAGGQFDFGIGLAGLQNYSPMARVKGSLVNDVGTELQGSLKLQVRPFNASPGQPLVDAIEANATSVDGEMCAIILARLSGAYVAKRVKLGAPNSGGAGFRQLIVDN
jgi:hypothetical protein